MPWKQHSASNWEREKHDLQMRLLKANAELRLKTIYAERLEILLHQRNEHIDALTAKLERAHTINRQLEQECEHIAHLIAASPDNASIPTTNLIAS